MSILIVPEARSRPLGKDPAIEPFIRDVISRHGHIENLELVKQGDGTWLYQATGSLPMMIQCHRGLTPIQQDSVDAFFGAFKIAQLQDSKLVGIIVCIGSSISHSARAHLQLIKNRFPTDELYMYGDDEVIELLTQQGKVASLGKLIEWAQRETGTSVERWDLMLMPGSRVWLIEFASSPRTHGLLEPMGAPLTETTLARLPWKQLSVLRPGCSLESVVNDQLDHQHLTAVTSMLPDEDSPREGFASLLNADRTLREQVEAVGRAGRRLLCPERGESVCEEFERIVLMFFDQLGPRDSGVTGRFQNSPDLDIREVAAMLASVRLVSLHLSAGWIHPHHRAASRIEDLARQIVGKAAPRSAWASAVPDIARGLSKAVFSLSTADTSDRQVQNKFEVIAALCIHLGAAFGPYCNLYRSTLHHNLLPDSPPLPSDAPLLEDVWTDPAAQLLRIVLDTPTPRVHRQVTTNRNLLQTVLERSEDALGQLGAMLPVTRVQLTARNTAFEVIDCYFELEGEHVLRIFMGEELYGSKDVWVRELLQNAIDATLLRKALLGEDGYDPKVTIFHDRASREVHVIDNGIGMSLYHVRKFFSKVGRSYYRSAELEEQLKRKNRKFNAISKFGVGFLSVFMAASSVEIFTSQQSGEDVGSGLNIYIPALMEDFYIRSVPDAQAGTTVILQLKNELEGSIRDLVCRYFICPDVDISIIEDGREVAVIKNELPPVVPNIVADGEWTALFDVVSIRISGEMYDGAICVPLPRIGPFIGERRADALWEKAPKNRLALAQAGIWVRDDDNSIFGEHRGYGNAYHPFFNRVYGLINFQPDALKMNVSRNEFVLEKAALNELKIEVLSKTSAALASRLEHAAQRIGGTRERSDYLRAIIFGAIEDGEHYYGRRESAATYKYSNSSVLTSAMAQVYARHVALDQRAANGSEPKTLAQILSSSQQDAAIYYSLASDIDKDPLFNAWMAEQSSNTHVLFVRTKREAALLYQGLQVLSYAGNLHELTRDNLRAAIRYQVVTSRLDGYMRACAGVVQFDHYKPTTAILIVPVTERTVSKAVGLAITRFNCPEPPYVLLDRQHWLADFLLRAADLAADRSIIEPTLREVCDLLILNVALGATNEVRREGMQAANNWLTRLYAAIESLGEGKDWQAVRDRSMLVMGEIIGTGRRRS